MEGWKGFGLEEGDSGRTDISYLQVRCSAVGGVTFACPSALFPPLHIVAPSALMLACICTMCRVYIFQPQHISVRLKCIGQAGFRLS